MWVCVCVCAKAPISLFKFAPVRNTLQYLNHFESCMNFYYILPVYFFSLVFHGDLY